MEDHSFVGFIVYRLTLFCLCVCVCVCVRVRVRVSSLLCCRWFHAIVCFPDFRV